MYVISDRKSLDEVLQGIVLEKYLYEESVNLGITGEPKFILDKKDYMNRLVLDAYYKNNFYNNQINQQDMQGKRI